MASSKVAGSHYGALGDAIRGIPEDTTLCRETMTCTLH